MKKLTAPLALALLAIAGTGYAQFTQINGSQIKDGTITNKQMSADAHIYWSKVDFTGFTASTIGAEPTFTATAPLVKASGVLSLSTVPVENGGTHNTTFTEGHLLVGESYTPPPPGTAYNRITSLNDLYWNKTTGRLGLKVPSPVWEIDVNGSIQVTGTYYSTMFQGHSGEIVYIGDGGQLFPTLYLSLDPTTHLMRMSSGDGISFITSVNPGSGNGNLFMGAFNVGSPNTTGADNISLGAYAMNALTTGSENQGIGYGTLGVTTTGNNNFAAGFNALQKNTAGSDNVAIGYRSGYSYHTPSSLGTCWTYLPGDSIERCAANITGNYNTWVGSETGSSKWDGTQLTNASSFGYHALNDKSNQVVLGNSDVTEVKAGQDGTATVIAKGVTGHSSAVAVSITQTSHAFVLGNVLRMTGAASTFALAQADTADHSEVIGIVTEVVDADHFLLTVSGAVSVSAYVFPAGDPLYLSVSTPGAVTNVPPTSGQISKPIGTTITSAVLMILNIQRGIVVP